MYYPFVLLCLDFIAGSYLNFFSLSYSKVMDRAISVEYAAREDGDPRIRGGRGLSPSCHGGGRGGATRGSPDYSRARSPPRGGGRNHR